MKGNSVLRLSPLIILQHRMIRALVVAFVAVQFWGQSLSAQPLVTGVDHFYVYSPAADSLLRFFEETFELPVAWPFAPQPGFSSGGLAVGNTIMEFARYPLEPGESRPTAFEGIVFEPVATADSVAADLERRGIPYWGPEVFRVTRDGVERVGWTLVGYEGLPPAGASIMVCDYADRASVDWRDEHADLAERGGGPLGLLAVEEIVVGVADVPSAAQAWRAALMPEEDSASPVLTFPRGPAVRLVASSAPGVEGVILRVRSLARARAFLAENGLLDESASPAVRVAGTRVEGLPITLVGDE